MIQQVFSNLWKSIHNPHVFRVIAIIFYIFQNIPSNFNIEVIPVQLIFFWGIYLIMFDFFTKKIMFQPRYSYLILFILFSFALSAILNISYQFPHGPINGVYLAQTLLLVYPFDQSEEAAETHHWMIRFNDVVITIIFIAGFISVLLYAFQAQYWVINGSGTTWLRQGFLENRLFGVYTSPNFGSMLGLISIFLSFVNNILKRNSILKFQAVYIINIFIQYIYFILSSSRGTHFTVLTILACSLLYYFIHSIYNKKMILKSMLKTAFAGIAALFIFFSFNSSTQQIMSYIPTIVETGVDLVQGDFSFSLSEELQSESARSTSQGPVVIQHSDEGSELSSGRFTIWKAGIKATLQRPLFGLSDGDIYSNTSAYETPRQIDTSELDQMDRSELKRASGNMHNAYVSIFVYSGLIGLILFIVWGLLYAYHHFLGILGRRFNLNRSNQQLYALIVLMLLAILANNFVETHILYSNRNSIGFIFWTYAGYLNYLKNKNIINQGDK